MRAVLGVGSLVVAVIVLVVVLVGWLESPATLDAADAVVAAEEAFDRAGVAATVEQEATPGFYQPVSGGGPVAVWLTTASIGEASVDLYLRRTDAAPVYLDDRAEDGASQVLGDAQFSALIGHVEHPGRDDRLLRNILLTVAAAAILAVTLAVNALPLEDHR